jgi:hypothetical protein
VKRLDSKNHFKALYPHLAEEGHPLKNGDLTPDKVSPESHKKVWWICENDHQWQTSVRNRSQGSECPYCSGRRPSPEYNLAVLHPEVARQWHPTKNKKSGLTPDQLTPGTNKEFWWICDDGHEWEAAVKRRSKGAGCPYCAFLKTKEYKKEPVAIAHPELVEEWHPTKNGDLTPDKVTAGSDLEVWWLCEQGHEWQTVVRSRCTGVECPYCSGRIPSEDYNLQVINPEVAKQWHPTKNRDLTPDNILPFSTKKVWWLCEKGHEWQAPVARRHRNNCPHCARERHKKS